MQSSDRREVCLFGIRTACPEAAEFLAVVGGGDTGIVGTPCGALFEKRGGGRPPGGVKDRSSGCLPPFRTRASFVQGGALPSPILDSISPRTSRWLFRSPPKLSLCGRTGTREAGLRRGLSAGPDNAVAIFTRQTAS